MTCHRQRQKWTPDRDAQLTALWNAGIPASDIAVRMFTTAGAIMDRRSLLRLPKRKDPRQWTDAESDAVRKLWAAGKSASDIAMVLPGKSRNAVIGRIHRLGLTDASRSKAAPKATYAPRVKAPAVRHGPASPRGANQSPPKPGPHLKPGAVFGPVATLDPAEALRRSNASAKAGKKLIEGFAAAANDHAIPLIERRFGQCSWPVGEPARPAEQLCCGQPVPADANKAVPTYCAFHADRAVSRARLGGQPDAKAYERSMRRFANA